LDYFLDVPPLKQHYEATVVSDVSEDQSVLDTVLPYSQNS